MTYPGGKGTAYHTIINLIPPHNVYIEAFFGAGSVMQYKRPARLNLAFDLDPSTKTYFDYITHNHPDADAEWVFKEADAIEYLRWLASDPNAKFTENVFIYLDPPYLLETRSQQRPIYTHELTDTQHRELLSIIKALPCHVMISSYWSKIYAKTLKDWHIKTFQAITRGGSQATEYLWMNYTPPNELHDYRYLGRDFRERERIRKKKARWIQRLRKMPKLERLAMAAAITECVEVIDGRSHHRM